MPDPGYSNIEPKVTVLSTTSTSTTTETETTSTTTTSTTISTTTSSTSTTTTTTNSSTLTTTTTASSTIRSTTNQTAILIEIHDIDAAGDDIEVDLDDDHSGDNGVAIEHVDRQSCEILDSDWICSNQTQNLSLCFKSCSNGDTEQKRCICEKSSCSWYHKGNKCPTPSSSDLINPAELTLPINMPTEDMNEELPMTNEPNQPGNLPYDNISSSQPTNDLMSLVHAINVANSGFINVNLNLR